MFVCVSSDDDVCALVCDQMCVGQMCSDDLYNSLRPHGL